MPGPLDDLTGKHITLNGVPLPDRKTLAITASGATASDSDVNNTTTLNLSAIAASVADGAVTAAKLASGAVTATKLDGYAGAYATYSALRTALAAGEMAAGDTVRVASRSIAGDGGHGEFSIVAIGSYVDNDGTVLVGGSFAALRKIDGLISVAWFGAKADNSTNDRAAINAAAALGHPIKLMRGIHAVSGGVLTFTSDLFGEGAQAFADTLHDSGISLGAGCRLEFTGKSTIQGLTVYGNYQATNGIYVHNFNGGAIRDVIVRETLRDGVLASTTGNNNDVICEGLSTIACGSTYATGTVTGALGTTTLTFSGAADLTTIGIRIAQDYIYITDDATACLADYAARGNESELPILYEIVTVSASSITIYPPLWHAVTSSAYSIKMGSGVSLTQNGDNGGWKFTGGYHQNNRSAGIQEISLYGSTTDDVTFEGNAVGRAIGRRDGASQVCVFGWTSNKDYNETSTTIDVLVAYAQRGTVIDGSGGSQGDGSTKIVAYPGSYFPNVVADRTKRNVVASPYIVPSSAQALGQVTVVTAANDFTAATVTVQDEIGGLYAFPAETTLTFRAPRGGLSFSAASAGVKIDGAGIVFPEGLVFLHRLAQNSWVAAGASPGSPLLKLRSGLSVKSALVADYGITYSGTLRGEGTSPPTVSFTGTPTAPFVLDIVSAGTLGVSTIRYSTDEQVTWSTPVATAASLVLSGLGITLTMSAGTYSADNLYRPRITSLGDQSGAGNSISQSTDSAKPAAVYARNGKLGVQFFGAQNMSRSTLTGGALSQPLAHFLVGRWPATGVQTLVDGSSSRLAVYQNSPDNVTAFAGSSADLGTPAANEWFVMASLFNGANFYGICVFANGRTVEIDTVANVGTNTRNGTVWGADFGGSSNLTGILCAEIIVEGRMSRKELWAKLDDLRRYYAI